MKTETPDYILISEKKLSKDDMIELEKEIITYYEKNYPGKKIAIAFYLNDEDDHVFGVSAYDPQIGEGAIIQPKPLTPPGPHHIGKVRFFRNRFSRHNVI